MRKQRILGVALALAAALATVTATGAQASERTVQARDWTPIAAGAGWPACEAPITWSIDPGDLSPAQVERQRPLLAWAFDAWAEASGLRFLDAGTIPTQFVPASQDLAPADGTTRSRHIYITWMTPEDAPALAGRTSGFAAPDRVQGSEISGARAVFKADYVAANTRRSPAHVKALYLHEIGHALGLGHAASPHNRMYGIVDAATRLGAGDITGIRTLTRPCGSQDR